MALKNLGDVKLEIIQGVSNLEVTKGNESLLFKMLGYIECLADKNIKN